MNYEESKQFIKANYHLSYRDLAIALNKKEDTVRRMYRRLGLPHKKINSQVVIGKCKDYIKEKFIAFLSKGRTESEIASVFGTNYKKLLEAKYEGYEIFSQRNRYNHLIYILLPEIRSDIKILPKKWKYHIGKSDEGIEQPYLIVNLPTFKGKIFIAPLFDIHYGNFAHRKEKFLSYIRWIKENDNVYAIIGGDLIENAIDDGRGMTYDQTVNPQNQVEDMIKILSPIAHKILVATNGNHEERTYQKTGIDSMKIICDRLNVPHFTGPVIMSVMANTFKWTFYIQHGRGNSQTKGGKMNMANRPKNFTNDIQFLVSGHVHDLIVEPEACIMEDPENCRLVYMTQWTVVCPAFLGYENTYAYRAGYKPPARGGVSILLYENGEYRAELTTS